MIPTKTLSISLAFITLASIAVFAFVLRPWSQDVYSGALGSGITRSRAGSLTEVGGVDNAQIPAGDHNHPTSTGTVRGSSLEFEGTIIDAAHETHSSSTIPAASVVDFQANRGGFVTRHSDRTRSDVEGSQRFSSETATTFTTAGNPSQIQQSPSSSAFQGASVSADLSSSSDGTAFTAASNPSQIQQSPSSSAFQGASLSADLSPSSDATTSSASPPSEETLPPPSPDVYQVNLQNSALDERERDLAIKIAQQFVDAMAASKFPPDSPRYWDQWDRQTFIANDAWSHAVGFDNYRQGF